MSYPIDMHQKLDEHDPQVITNLKVHPFCYVILNFNQVPTPTQQANNSLQIEQPENLSNNLQKGKSLPF